MTKLLDAYFIRSTAINGEPAKCYVFHSKSENAEVIFMRKLMLTKDPVTHFSCGYKVIKTFKEYNLVEHEHAMKIETLLCIVGRSFDAKNNKP